VVTNLDSSQGDEKQSAASSVPAIDLSSVIARTLASVRDDPAQLRNAIYELARVKLQKEAWASNMSILAARRLMLALETAIERVETVSSQQDELLRRQSNARFIVDPASDVYHPVPNERESIDATDPAPGFDRDVDRAPPLAPSRPRPRKPTWRSAHSALLLRIGAVALAAIVVIFVLGRQFALFDNVPRAGAAKVTAAAKKGDIETAAAAPVPAAPERAALPQSHSPALPLPSVYGVYALSDGRLYELEALPGRVPDQRVHMTALMTTPSRTTLPDGRIEFIVYRRDVAASAPDHVQVRVIAKIARSMGFDKAGRSSIAPVADQWTIRGNSYDLRVAPISESAEMLMLRPEKSDFVFPAGRYGLVLKSQAYDFTIAGPITDAAQCLERTEAANGGFYSECRSP
jgi:hypothetical protein